VVGQSWIGMVVQTCSRTETFVEADVCFCADFYVACGEREG